MIIENSIQFIEDKEYTIDEYLSIEPFLDEKHAYYNGKVVNVSDGIDYTHCIISANVITELKYPKHKDLLILSSQMRYFIAAKSIFVYPDISIIEGKPQLFNNRDDVVENPSLIVEITSALTESFDKGEKFDWYLTLTNLKEYILVSQRQKEVEVRTLNTENIWETRIYKNPTDNILLKTSDIKIILEELYRGVIFS